MIKLENSKINRLKFARAFSNIPKVDISIDCVIENQMGAMFADNEEDPQVFMTKNGPFTYIASTTSKEVVADFVKDIPAPCLVMPSSKCVTDEIKKQYKDSVVLIPRYSCVQSNIEPNHIKNMFNKSPHKNEIIPLPDRIIKHSLNDQNSFIDLSMFDSAEDFKQRGLGFIAVKDNKTAGFIYSALSCSKGVEVSLFVEEEYRRKGVATALSAKFLMECLSNNITPHWDAANPESLALAKKLGMKLSLEYEAIYIKQKAPKVRSIT